MEACWYFSHSGRALQAALRAQAVPPRASALPRALQLGFQVQTTPEPRVRRVLRHLPRRLATADLQGPSGE